MGETATDNPPGEDEAQRKSNSVHRHQVRTTRRQGRILGMSTGGADTWTGCGSAQDAHR